MTQTSRAPHDGQVHLRSLNNTEDPQQQFAAERRRWIEALVQPNPLQGLSTEWINQAAKAHYTYLFSWLGRPIIQFPQDMVAVQEIIWEIKPHIIIETGIAHGGSLMLSASMLALIEYCEAIEEGRVIDTSQSRRRVIGVDIDIRAHNRRAIESHPLSSKITMISGSSTDPITVAQVQSLIPADATVLVLLDSNHTHEHVLAELENYAPMVSPGSYCIVFDTVIENMPTDAFPDRPWGVGNNPMTAVHSFLANNSQFEIDEHWCRKLQITVAPQGYLRRRA